MSRIHPDSPEVCRTTIIVPHGFESNYTVGFVRGLVANGVALHVITSDSDHVRLQECGVPCVNLRGSQDSERPAAVKAVNLIRYYARLLAHVRTHAGSVVHVTGMFRGTRALIEGVVLGLAFRVISSRYIYTAHNVLPHNKGDSRFYRWLYRLVYEIPDVILVHTPLTARQLTNKFFVPEAKIVAISIGLNEEMPITRITRVAARTRLGLGLEDRVVLFFGKADAYKGLDTLVEAFGQPDLPQAKLLISCWFDNPSYRRQILSAIAASPRKADIHLHESFLPNDAVELYFKSADVLVLPYRNIYQSGVVFLSFRFGLPLVATDVGSLHEYVEEDMGIITESNDPQGVADGIRRFFDQQERFRRDRIAEKGQKYRWDRVCQALVPLYRQRQRKG